MGASFSLAGLPLRTLDRMLAAVAGVTADGLVVIVRKRHDISLAVTVSLETAAGKALQHVVGGAPCLALFGVAGPRSIQRLAGIGNRVAVAVVFDQPGGLVPGAPAADAVGDLAEDLEEVDGLVDLGGGGAGSAPPGEFSDDVAVGDAEVGVGLHFCFTVLPTPEIYHLGIHGALPIP